MKLSVASLSSGGLWKMQRGSTEESKTEDPKTLAKEELELEVEKEDMKMGQK